MNKQFRLLSIGNSFSEDAQRYIYDILVSLGYQNIVVANLYIGGAPLKLHALNASQNNKTYTLQIYMNNGYETHENISIKDALEAFDFNYVTLQQASHDSGLLETFNGYIESLISYVKQYARNQNIKFYYHLTWSYHKDSLHPGFIHYGNDDLLMTEKILDVYHLYIKKAYAWDGIISNLSTMFYAKQTGLNDLLYRDGYHLNYVHGRYLASVMFVSSILEKNVINIDGLYCPKAILSEEFKEIKSILNKAYLDPFLSDLK